MNYDMVNTGANLRPYLNYITVCRDLITLILVRIRAATTSTKSLPIKWDQLYRSNDSDTQKKKKKKGKKGTCDDGGETVSINPLSDLLRRGGS